MPSANRVSIAGPCGKFVGAVKAQALLDQELSTRRATRVDCKARSCTIGWSAGELAVPPEAASEIPRNPEPPSVSVEPGLRLAGTEVSCGWLVEANASPGS